MGMFSDFFEGFDGQVQTGAPVDPPPAAASTKPTVSTTSSGINAAKVQGYTNMSPEQMMQNASNLALNNVDESGEKIIATLGAPPYYPPNADLYRRTWTETLGVNAPIVTILPGQPGLINGGSTGIEEREKALADMFSRVDTGSDTKDQQALMADIKKLATSTRGESMDMRFFNFKADPMGYSMAFNVLLSFVGSRLSDGAFIVDNPVQTDKWGGLNFYVDKGTSISESISNTYEDSFMKGLLDGATSYRDKAAEAFGALIGGTSAVDATTYTDLNATAMSNIKGALTSGAGTGGLGGMFSSVVAGNKVLMPKLWQDSSFNRTYTLSMKFESLYGTKEDVFTDVLVPTIAVLALALPIQTHTSAYSRPFIIQVDSPGWFHLDCAVITDVTIKRSPNPEDWTDFGLSRKIELEVTVTDLYPTIMLSQHMFAATNNIGLNSYLSSIAGMNYKQINVPSYWEAFQTASNYWYNTAVDFPGTVMDKLGWENRNILSWFT